MVKGRGYVWGLSSTVLSSISLFLPFVAVISGSRSRGMDTTELALLILSFGLPPVGFVLAFVGRVRSNYGTQARKLCNAGARMGLVMSAILIWSMGSVLLQDVFSVPEYPAVITGLVDTVLIYGYFRIAYSMGKILWFLSA